MASDARASSGSAARRVRRSTALRGLARAGYVASGILHLLVGVLAVRLATGRSGGTADQAGAFQQLAQAPGGAALLWAVAVGLAALALWQLTEVVVGAPAADAGDRLRARGKAAAKAVLYAALASMAARYVQGSGGGGEQESLTSGLMASVPGRWLIGAVGAAVVGVGVLHVVKGAKKWFLRDLRSTGGGEVGAAVERLGQAGYVAKGVALAVTGGLVVAAALTADAERAGGLDQGLRTIGQQPAGTALLVVTGLGIAAYGVYSFARARYARL